MEITSAKTCETCKNKEICRFVKRFVEINKQITEAYKEEDTPLIISFSCKFYENGRLEKQKVKGV